MFGYLARHNHFELYPVNPNITEMAAYQELPAALEETLKLSPRPI